MYNVSKRNLCWTYLAFRGLYPSPKPVSTPTKARDRRSDSLLCHIASPTLVPFKPIQYPNQRWSASQSHSPGPELELDKLIEHGESVPREPEYESMFWLLCRCEKLLVEEEGLIRMWLILGSLRERYRANMAADATESRRLVLNRGVSRNVTVK